MFASANKRGIKSQAGIKQKTVKTKQMDINKNLEFLVGKSRDLIKDQLSSYENSTSKSGIMISISALLTPIAISIISNIDFSFILRCLTLIPIILMTIALIYFFLVLHPKGLDHGMNFNKFEELVTNEYQNILLYEIGANRDSYNDNLPIVTKQTRYYKHGTRFIFYSAIILFTLVTISMFTESENKAKTEIKIGTQDSLIITKKIKFMTNSNDSTGENQTQPTPTPQQTQPTTTTIVIPSVPSVDRANLEKGEDSKPLGSKPTTKK